jgi:nicotinate phosphoribosyltransferase
MIKSLCDTDLYKLTMMQVVFEKYTNVHVRYDFKCRSGEFIPSHTPREEYIGSLIEWIKHMCSLKFTKEELEYLSKIRFFKPNFIEFLRTFQLNFDYVNIGTDGDDNVTIIIEGPWISTILFEVPLLATVSELYHFFNQETGIGAYLKGKENFLGKIDYLDKNIHRDQDLRIVDLGTRRRFSYEWQLELLRMACHSRYIKGTSNIHFAMKLGLTPVGTMAHEYVCAHQQLGRVEDSQKAAFQAWADVYRGDLGIALSDTVGFNAFLKDFDLYFAKLFDGARHDSGCPYNWCEQLIKHYNRLEIDPKSKIAVFSDGLTFEIIVKLFQTFNNQIKTSFGIGTNLTNDMGVKPLQIVIKMTECNGRPVAKISDSPGKGMCLDPKFDEYIRQVFQQENWDK